MVFWGFMNGADASLAKSLNDFADEREAAGRPVPDVLWPGPRSLSAIGSRRSSFGSIRAPWLNKDWWRRAHWRMLVTSALGHFLWNGKSEEDDPQVIEAIERALSLLDAQSKS